MSINIQQPPRKQASLINHSPQSYVGDLPTRPLTSQSSKTVSFLFHFVILLALLITILLVNHQTQYQGHAAAPQYFFGTLETANGQIFDQLGLSYTQVAQREHTSGVGAAQMTIAWKDYETSDGVFNENEMSWYVSNIKAFLQAGQKVDIQFATHYVPSWVIQIPNSSYINQYGVTEPLAGNYGWPDPNYVFNATVRQKVQDFITHTMQQLNSQIGINNIFEIRLDAGDGSEAIYGPSNDGSGHTNSYWAYDANAQCSGGNLPSGVSCSPSPGWQPGQTTYKGQPFTISQVQQWYDWYFNSRMNFYNWQINLYRSLGYNGFLPIETPGFGTRPDEYTKNMNAYLDGSGDPNGTMSRAAVWQKLYPAITNKTNMVAYISSMADGSGNPADNVCQSTDSTINFNTDTTVDSWSAVRYVSYIANLYGLAKGGENPGYGGGGAGADYGQVMTQNAAAQMQTCGLIGMFYAHDQNLYEGTNNFYLQDYATIFAQYNSTTTITPVSTATSTPPPTETATPKLTPIPLSTKTPTPISDTIPPTVKILSPLNGSTVSRHRRVNITASASDNVGVTVVSYSINGLLLCRTTTAPYTCSWSVPRKHKATYIITATAYNLAGLTGTNSVTVSARW